MTAFWSQPDFWLYFVAWLAFLSLASIYGFGSPWYGSPVGRSLLLMKVAILAVLTHVLLLFVFGDYPGSNLVRFITLSGVTVIAWYQVVVWRGIQRAHRNGDHPRRRSTDHPVSKEIP